MSLTLVTVRARTKGKTPTDFTYEGIGKVVARNLQHSVNGKLVDQTRADGSKVEVDDVDASGATTSLQDVIDLFGSIESETPVEQRVINAALLGFNLSQRKAASPVSETAPKEDELTPIIAAMREAGVLVDRVNEDGKAVDAEGIWRRGVTSGSSLVGMSRLDFAQMTKEYKALQALGK